MKLTINEEFRKLIPPLGPEEFAQLEANILADGCRDPLVVWNGTLIDGHNRYTICQKHGIKFSTLEIVFSDIDEACVWIIRNQFGRRNLAVFTRVELALRLEEHLRNKAKKNQGKRNDIPQNSAECRNDILSDCPYCGVRGKHVCKKATEGRESRNQLAKIAGVSRDTIIKGKLVAKHSDEATKKRLRENQISIHRVAKDIKETLQKEERKAKRVESAKSAPELDDRIIVGDFRENSDRIADGSLSLIFTDPPYDREASKMLPDLGAFAKAKLAEGGSLILYVGQTQLPAAIDALRPHLRYWWTIACIHAGRSTVMREYGVNAGWKAVLWFVKGTRDDNSTMVSDVMSGGQEKQHHDWQQSESEAAYWIGKLCPEDGIVCDPFLGGGTTAAAAKSLSRQWIGFEIDEDNAKVASGRLLK